MCVVKYLKSVHAPPVKNISSKVKQVWKATGKLFANVGYQWKPTGKKFTLGEQCPLTRITNSKVVPLQQPEHVSTSEIVITKRFSNTTQKPLTRTPTEIGDPTYQTLHLRLFSNAGRTDRPVVFGLRLLKTYDGESLTAQEFHEKVHRDRQFCDSDLEVAFRKHLCYVRDVDGVKLLKASKNKSWLWHRRLNHLNFGTINDLARKDLNSSAERHCRKTESNSCGSYSDNADISKALMFLWAEAVATACYTQNRSLIHTRHNKTPYELVHDKKPDLKCLRVFCALCYPTNDNEDLGKLKAITDIGIFVGYAPNKKEPPSVERPVPPTPAVQVPVVSVGVAAGPTIKDNPFAQAKDNPFVNVFAPEPSSEESSSGDDHPMDNVIGNPSRPVSTRKQLATDALWCLYTSVLLKVKPKNVKTVMDEACWFEAIQEEIHEFDQL
ncbi:retrovirus-related pol polyprotein from transposon TNT 1-94 [Tanacetum coccineum]